MKFRAGPDRADARAPARSPIPATGLVSRRSKEDRDRDARPNGGPVQRAARASACHPVRPGLATRELLRRCQEGVPSASNSRLTQVSDSGCASPAPPASRSLPCAWNAGASCCARRSCGQGLPNQTDAARTDRHTWEPGERSARRSPAGRATRGSDRPTLQSSLSGQRRVRRDARAAGAIWCVAGQCARPRAQRVEVLDV
jgi:hypothetical protein